MQDKQAEPDYDAIAKDLLSLELAAQVDNMPAAEGIMVRWKDKVYIGSLQCPYREYSEEIVALSKSTYVLSSELAGAIVRNDPERPTYEADDDIDLTDRLHILRKVGKRLTIMTNDQTRYAMAHPPGPMDLSDIRFDKPGA